MNLSEFAQMLYVYKGADKKQPDFLLDLVRNIMATPTLKVNIEMDAKGEYNPLDKMQSNSLGKIYNGQRQLSSNNAKKILDFLDKENFEAFIDDSSEDSKRLLAEKLQAKGVDVSKDNVPLICTDIFVSILNDCANRKRNLRVRPPLNQLSPDKDDIAYVTTSQTTTGAVSISVKNKQLVYPEVRQILLSETDASGIESELEVEESGLPELSEPKYYREYRQELLKQFEMYATWNSEPLDPGLIEKWGSVCITDEFYRSIKGYGIEDFLALAPSDLQPIRKVLTEGNVADHIRSAVRFVEHMEPAMDHMLITRENQKIFLDIVKFVELLGRYNRFLRENSNNSDLFINEPILLLPDDKKLEQKANEYYDELKSRLEDLEKRLKAEDERRQDND